MKAHHKIVELVLNGRLISFVLLIAILVLTRL